MATIPTAPTFNAGQVVTANELNNISGIPNFLMNPPRCNVQQHNAQTMPSSGYVAVTWDTETQDTDNMHSTSSNSTRVVANTAGSYLLSVQLAGPANLSVSNGLIVQLRKNAAGASGGGTLVPGGLGTQNGTGNGAACYVSFSILAYMAVGDYVELFAGQTNGSASANLSPTNGNFSSLTALWIATS